MQRCRGAKVQRLQRCKGAKVQRAKGKGTKLTAKIIRGQTSKQASKQTSKQTE